MVLKNEPDLKLFMCGFAGILDFNGFDPFSTKKLLKNMGNKILYRGPDDEGVWIDPNNFFGVIHRRLSILDLTKNGHQPMISKSKKFIISYNGEIYNHLEIREYLKIKFNFINWNGTSDTETLLYAIELLGLEKTLELTIGMFAFALWDTTKKDLFLVRDRMGEKPLYYGKIENTFLFCSDLNSLEAFPGFQKQIRYQSVNSIILHNYIPAPNSIYKNFFKLEPGSILIVRKGQKNIKKKYWSIKNNGVFNPQNKDGKNNKESLFDNLEYEINESVKKQLISDVPIGAFLSGGIDSSTIVSIMQKHSINRVKTFSIGLKDSSLDESVAATKIAKYLNTDHTNMIISPKDLESLVDKITNYYSEPFSDSSQIPTLLVSKLARRHVKVALSGDGGDELFCGYNRYLFTKKFWNLKSKFPKLINNLAARLIKSLSEKTYDFFLKNLTNINNIGDKIHKGSNLLDAKSIEDLYFNLILHFKYPANLINKDYLQINYGYYDTFHDVDHINSQIHKLMYVDQMSYLPDDILVKLDRASMAFSLETRVPLLNHKIVELSWLFPENLKIFRGKSKWPLRKILYKYVPESLIEGPKKGFGIPLDSWIRKELRVLINDILISKTELTQNILKSNYLNKILNDHFNERNNWQYLIWNIFILQKWFIRNKF